ncbi:MAG: S41 family peptidase [Gammaproteobacteria bacterium]|nr:S41 family peptidase [Gammaproteobacteria bacterium]
MCRPYCKTAIALLLLCITSNGAIFAKDSNQPGSVPYTDIRRFTDAFAQIKANYVEEISDELLLESAIRGMLDGLDPHSSYLSKDDFSDLQESTSGEFGGLGIEVTMENGFIKVVSPIDDTPAQRAGVKPGDLLIRLDDKPVKGMDLNDAVKLMRGKPGTSIELLIVREGSEGPFKLIVERDVIRIKSVRGELLEPDYAYVRLSTFQTRTGRDMVNLIEKLRKENKQSLKGLILDLRNNPGGVLSAAREVADAFLEEGLVVYTKGRAEDAEMKYNATPGDIINGAPLIVMVNEGSASASEIVAGAIQDHVRGILMGTATFGKASVQTVLPLDSGTAIKLTTARYYTPKGRSIQAEGIKPDIKLRRAKIELLEDEPVDPIKESDLSGHLDNPQEKTTKPNAKSQQAKKRSLVNRDYELFEALNLLKGIDLLQTKGQ